MFSYLASTRVQKTWKLYASIITISIVISSSLFFAGLSDRRFYIHFRRRRKISPNFQWLIYPESDKYVMGNSWEIKFWATSTFWTCCFITWWQISTHFGGRFCGAMLWRFVGSGYKIQYMAKYSVGRTETKSESRYNIASKILLLSDWVNSCITDLKHLNFNVKHWMWHSWTDLRFVLNISLCRKSRFSWHFKISGLSTY